MSKFLLLGSYKFLSFFYLIVALHDVNEGGTSYTVYAFLPEERSCARFDHSKSMSINELHSEALHGTCQES